MRAIFAMTIREIFHKKIFHLAALLNIIFLVLFTALLYYAGRDFDSMPDQALGKAYFYPQILSMGMFFSSFLLNLLAVFLSVGCISSEVESGVLQAIVTKPLPRRSIVLGKYMGYAAVLAGFAAAVFLTITAIIRVTCSYTPANNAAGLGLFILQPLVMLTLAVWGSTMLSTMANGVMVIMLYILATVGGMAELVGNLVKNANLINTGIFTSLLVPVDAVYRKMVSIMLAAPDDPLNSLAMSPFGAAVPPSGPMLWYTGLYIAFFLIMAVRFFGSRDL